MTEDLDAVLSERRILLSLAYRMTGTLADAEDIVQETYVRWYRLGADERAGIENVGGWLTRTASRIALDVLGSARRRRERYIGQWLPEPVSADLFAGTAPATGGSVTAGALAADPLERVTLDDAISTALLIVLEAMTPAERVAFVLHDVFGMPFAEISDIVGRSPAAVRQLAASGRRHVRESRTSLVPRADHDAAVRAFRAASQTGDIDQLMRVLAPDVQLRSDGGGVVNAAPNVVAGADRVARFLLGIGAKDPELVSDEQPLGDGLGLVIRVGETPMGVMSFHVEGGLITDVWIMLNPAKLTVWLPTPSGAIPNR
ncbi:MAG: RNA polymerase subunit sigma-24 [Microbacterium sp.]|uniref:RNA polymerase sigma factor SigJ n=1 Tax=Microbacterium sp. TaxID=51671 RepID=UPI000DB069AF|nr:RNA polymerase sigma factor SigJ [Microbacterium sp.]PZU36666.1 MAG: RNA polymerase subunit sigma-24 [Microbacterium sp.]